MAITPKSPGTISPPNSPTAEAEGSVAVPNSPTGQSVGSVALPNSPTAETVVDVGVPNLPTAETVVDVAAPNSPTAQAVVDVGLPTDTSAWGEVSGDPYPVPNSPTAQTVVDVAVPNSPTAETVVDVDLPNSPTAETVVDVSVPNTLTATAVAGFPRALEPLVGMNFADELYVQDNRPVLFDDLFTYSRNSNATFWNRRVDRNGKWETFLDTDYIGSVTNLLTYSEQFDHADWTKTNTTVAANYANNSDGDKVADLVYPTTAGADREITQAITGTTAEHNVSFEVKESGFDWVRILDAAGTNGAWFNIKAGVIGTITGACEPSIIYLGDDWYQCSIGDAGSVSGSAELLLADADNSATATANGTDGVLVCKAQATLGIKPLPYVKTISASDSQTFTESLRLEYDPITAEAKGALIEGGSTNLIEHSEEFSDAVWTNIAATITDNDAIAPDETTSADKFASDATASQAVTLRNGSTVTSASQNTMSIYVKKAEATFVQFHANSGDVANDPRVNYDLTNGVLGIQDADIDDATITDVGNGCYRVTATMTAVATSLAFRFAIIQSATDTRFQSNSWTVGDGVHVWGAQCEELPFASSYNRTEGAPAGRASDATVGELYIGSVMSVDILSAYINSPELDSSGRVAVSISDNTTANTINIYNRNGSANGLFIEKDNVTQFVDDGFAITDNSFTRTIVTIKENDSGIYQNGDLSANDTSILVPEISQINIGSNQAGTGSLYGHIKLLNIYEEAMTAQEVMLYSKKNPKH